MFIIESGVKNQTNKEEKNTGCSRLNDDLFHNHLEDNPGYQSGAGNETAEILYFFIQQPQSALDRLSESGHTADVTATLLLLGNSSADVTITADIVTLCSSYINGVSVLYCQSASPSIKVKLFNTE